MWMERFIRMTRKAIAKALPFWQKVLRLEDWRVDVEIAKASVMDDAEGLNYIHPEELYSQIQLRRGATEETLVHELLHLVFDGDGPLREYDVLHERGINRVAEALVNLRYKCSSTIP